MANPRVPDMDESLARAIHMSMNPGGASVSSVQAEKFSTNLVSKVARSAEPLYIILRPCTCPRREGNTACCPASVALAAIRNGVRQKYVSATTGRSMSFTARDDAARKLGCRSTLTYRGPESMKYLVVQSTPCLVIFDGVEVPDLFSYYPHKTLTRDLTLDPEFIPQKTKVASTFLDGRWSECRVPEVFVSLNAQFPFVSGHYYDLPFELRMEIKSLASHFAADPSGHLMAYMFYELYNPGFLLWELISAAMSHNSTARVRWSFKPVVTSSGVGNCDDLTILDAHAIESMDVSRLLMSGPRYAVIDPKLFKMAQHMLRKDGVPLWTRDLEKWSAVPPGYKLNPSTAELVGSAHSSEDYRASFIAFKTFCASHHLRVPDVIMGLRL